MDTMTFVWMFVVLKVPIVAALLLIWWAVKEPEPAPEEPGNEGGSDRERPPGPRHPRSPRRGPHIGVPPTPPARVRVAKGRRLSRSG